MKRTGILGGSWNPPHTGYRHIEELTELCVCEGLEKHRLVNLLKAVLDDPDADDPASVCGKNLALLETYAAKTGQFLQTILDGKMQINRQRATAQSAQRLAAKLQSMNGGPS